MRLLKHSTIHGYLHHHCRCELCKGAWAIYIKRRRSKLPKVKRLRPDNYARNLARMKA